MHLNTKITIIKNINIENTKCHDKTSGVERSIKWDLTEAESYLNSSEHQHVKKINDAKTPYVVIEETDDMYLNKLKEVNKIQVSKDMMEEVCRKIEEHKNQIEEGEKS